MDSRNSSARPTVRPQSLYFICILHSRHFKANPNTFIFIQMNHTSCSLQQSTRLEEQMLTLYNEIEITYFVDFKYIHKQRIYSMLRP